MLPMQVNNYSDLRGRIEKVYSSRRCGL